MSANLPLDRVLVIAPHPDDESIGTGALIQRVAAAGGRVQVVVITDGDNNLFPQRLAARRWRISLEDRARWGAMRREESRNALTELGAPASAATFLGYHDRTLARLAKRGDRRIVESLRGIMESFDPTLVVSPSILDLHADHRAAARFVHEAAKGRLIITYIVHGNGPLPRIAARLHLRPEEVTRKRDAIQRHQSQLGLSAGRFLSYAQPVEVFFRAEDDILRPDTLWWKWRCKTLHGWRVVRGKGAGESDQ
jgi:N-acetyl-1-D-myo-inositol-2-amino-2-deoxy-alpha-D-glucopyranoside deacetylase